MVIILDRARFTFSLWTEFYWRMLARVKRPTSEYRRGFAWAELNRRGGKSCRWEELCSEVGMNLVCWASPWEDRTNRNQCSFWGTPRASLTLMIKITGEWNRAASSFSQFSIPQTHLSCLFYPSNVFLPWLLNSGEPWLPSTTWVSLSVWKHCWGRTGIMISICHLRPQSAPNLVSEPPLLIGERQKA